MRRLGLVLTSGLTILASVACAGAPASAPASAPAGAPASGSQPAPAAPAAKETQAPPKPGGAAVPGDAKVVKFFGINALTGQSAAPGLRSAHGAELAAKVINDRGGFTDTCGNKYRVEVSSNDMANDRNQAISLTRAAAGDSSVLAVIGPSPSTGFVPMVPVAAQFKIPIMGAGTGAPIKEWNVWSYRSNAVPAVAEPLMVKTLREKFGFTKLALIYDQTQDGQVGAATVLRDKAGELGYEVVAFEAFRGGDQDFTTQLTKIKQTGVEWIGVYGAPPELAKVSRQIADLGIKAKTFTGFGNFQDPVTWDLAGGANKGAFNWSDFNLKSSDSKMSEFVNGYKAMHNGEEPTVTSGNAYDGIMAYVDAVKRSCTNTDREKFVAALAKTEGEGLGRFKFQNPPTGENLSPSIIVTQVTARGEFEVVK
ncbi:MAG: ABC transporter substrate-binding protein [Chloroflexi bacterium]|nr:ABC transporter substrate-binding protein [Chloroflexota bacterium]